MRLFALFSKIENCPRSLLIYFKPLVKNFLKSMWTKINLLLVRYQCFATTRIIDQIQEKANIKDNQWCQILRFDPNDDFHSLCSQNCFLWNHNNVCTVSHILSELQRCCFLRALFLVMFLHCCFALSTNSSSGIWSWSADPHHLILLKNWKYSLRLSFPFPIIHAPNEWNTLVVKNLKYLVRTFIEFPSKKS